MENSTGIFWAGLTQVTVAHSFGFHFVPQTAHVPCCSAHKELTVNLIFLLLGFKFKLLSSPGEKQAEESECLVLKSTHATVGIRVKP